MNGVHLPRARHRFAFPVIGVLSGLVGALGVLVLLQQFSVVFPTRTVVAVAVGLGAVAPVVVANIARMAATNTANARIAELEAWMVTQLPGGPGLGVPSGTVSIAPLPVPVPPLPPLPPPVPGDQAHAGPGPGAGWVPPPPAPPGGAVAPAASVPVGGPLGVVSAGSPSSNRWLIGAAVVLVIALVAGVVLVGGGDDTTAADEAPVGAPGEIFLERATSPGPAVFTKSVDRARPPKDGGRSVTPLTATEASAPTTAEGTILISTSPGGTPGLYGGTRDDGACDPAQLVKFLGENPDKARAWAEVLGIDPSRIAEYVARLTPVVLIADTRVTNHGYADGRATPRQSVLQAGTAALVDDRGVPRVRCRCGNPLLEPEPVQADRSYTGPSWEGFDPVSVAVVSPSEAPLATLVLTDVDTGERFERPVGSSGDADIDLGAGVPETTTSTSSGTTTSAPTTIGTTPQTITTTAGTGSDITARGTATASSEYRTGEFPAALAIDGDPTTSWFSAGDVDGPSSVYVWLLDADTPISEVRITGNAQQATPEFRQGFGFDSVTIRVIDGAGTTVFEQIHDLAGSPDPDVVVFPGVSGRSVALTLTGHESPDCGGIAELTVIGG